LIQSFSFKSLGPKLGSFGIMLGSGIGKILNEMISEDELSDDVSELW
jgi:glycine/D-amino acid oxidase-like deaminating enzyme